MPSTPDQKRKREELIKRFDNDWEIKIPTKEIARKNKRWYLKIFPRKHKIRALYIWAQTNWSTADMMPFETPIEHNKFQKPAGIPFVYAMKGGWTIPEDDLKYLIDGPLYSEQGELLVPEKRISLKQIFGWLWKLLLGIAVVWGLIDRIRALNE